MNKNESYEGDKLEDVINTNQTNPKKSLIHSVTTKELNKLKGIEKVKLLKRSNSRDNIKKNLKAIIELFGKYSRSDNFEHMYDEKLVSKRTINIDVDPVEVIGKKNVTVQKSQKALPAYNVEQRKKDLQLLKMLKQKVKVKKEEKIINLKTVTLEKGVFFALEANADNREFMEDFINVENDKNNQHQAYVLTDGHKGSKTAEFVSKKLPNVFFKCLNEETQNELNGIKYEKKEEDEADKNVIKRAIEFSFCQIDEMLKKELTEEEESGCTTNLTYLCCEDNKRVVYSGNIGDSRTVLVREGSSLRLSYDHKSSDKAEAKRVTDSGGLIIRKRLYGTLQITRSHGDFELKESTDSLISIPHITRTEILDTDRVVVMASDGLWDVITDEVLYGLVKDFNLAEGNLANFLLKKAMELKSKDNISVIVIILN